MYVLEVENEVGERLRLTQNESRYQVLKVDGLLPPKANIVTTSIASMDGERFKSSKLEMRNIVIQLKVRGRIEENRIALYRFFDNGNPLKILYRNGTRNVYCLGYCEDTDGDLFENGQTLQVSIVCPDPFWKDVNNFQSDISFSTGVFEFPFSVGSDGIEFSSYVANRETKIINIGEVASGLVIELKAIGGTVVNPVIYNVKTNEFIKVNVTLSDSDELIINTSRGHRSILKQDEDVFSSIQYSSTWLQLKRGVNIFTYNALSGEEFLSVKVSFNPMYKGV